MNVLAGVIWHYWLAVPLVGGGVALTVATLVGYFQKVSSTRDGATWIEAPAAARAFWRDLQRRE